MRATLTLCLALAAVPALGAGPTPSGPLDGMFVHLDGRSVLTDCHGGQRVAVDPEGDAAALERAYRTATRQPGAPLWVSLLGHVESRQKPDGGQEEALVVDRFARVDAGRGCASNIELPSARWTLVRLQGRPVPAADGRPAASLEFEAGKGRLSGSTGCNRINGEYRSWGVTGFAVMPLATTRMACPAPLAAQEAALLHALNSATHRIQAGNVLELLAGGVPVARFEAESPR